MATIVPETTMAPRLGAVQQLSTAPTKRQPRSRAQRRLILAIVLAALAAAIVGSSYALLNWLSHDTGPALITERVARADLLITVTEDGNVESANNVDVRCQVAGGSNILWIIPDGSVVKKGDEIVRLNSATIEDQVNLQKITYEKAQALRIQAEKEYSTAKISVQEYLEGTYVKELQTIEANITIANENLRSAQNSLSHTERLARKGYVTPLQLDAQRFAVERAKLDLATAETAKNVLEKFTKVKMLQDLQSLRDTAEAKMRSEQASTELEHTRLERLLTQLRECTIKAPQDGMVVYANEMSTGRGSSSVKIEEGATVRERQSIVRLPDLSQMQVKTIVHESKVDLLLPGMRARVNLQDHEYQGEITYVANQPESTSFFQANIKEYATIVRIDGRTAGLKPGMTAEVEILVQDLKNVVSVPVQAVVELNNTFFCWVKKGSGYERRPVVLGASNSTVIEIKDGLAEGDEVILNPRVIVPAARDEGTAEKVDVAKRFGASSKKGPASAATAAAGGLPGAAKAGGPRSASAEVAGGAAQRPQRSFKDLDRDGDGKVSREEAPPQMQGFFDTIDADHDGSISPEELSAARSRMQQQRQQTAPSDGAGAK
jgi:RND family efflux transporter MFP subunit